MPLDDVPRRYADLLELAHSISSVDAQTSLQTAARVKHEIEQLAHDFGGHLHQDR